MSKTFLLLRIIYNHKKTLLLYWWCLVLKLSFQKALKLVQERLVVNCVGLQWSHSFSPFSLLPFQVKVVFLQIQFPYCQQQQLLCALLTLHVFEKFCFRNCLFHSQSWKCSYCGAGVVYMSFHFYLHWNAAWPEHESTKMSWKWKCLSVTGLMHLSDWELEASILLWWAF